MDKNKKFNIYINDQAGSVLNMGTDILERIICESGIEINRLLICPPNQIIKDIQNEDGRFPVLIGGGDGTIRSCAQHLVKQEIPFGILPLGTMNLLAKDLNIPTNIKDAIQQYANGIVHKKIDTCSVNNEIFLCCASLGTIPHTSKMREQHRSESHPILIPRLTAYALKEMDRTKRQQLKVSLDEKSKTIKTSALVISNNQYSPQTEWTDNNFKRSSLWDGVMGIYSAAPYSLWDKIRFLFKLRLGDWRADQSLQEWQCKKLEINQNKKSALISLDGEVATLSFPLKFKVLPRSLSIVLPKRTA